ncbi:hypothetical protein PoB_007451600 [Plakobranchus ocellatus]|uniref:Uncharacterized protein n=1 Tax=Plakobranchus ocellatus TaxID=259542 RepID=A0AAV4DVS9_9GAST|nr:hypothetical protein PoB_007451600 [Plakobranchus ocellatus]
MYTYPPGCELVDLSPSLPHPLLAVKTSARKFSRVTRIYSALLHFHRLGRPGVKTMCIIYQTEASKNSLRRVQSSAWTNTHLLEARKDIQGKKNRTNLNFYCLSTHKERSVTVVWMT